MSTLAGFTEPTPHIPYFCRNGNYIVKQWEEFFDDGCGHRGIMMIIFYDKKKNKTSEPVMRYIKWEN